MSGATALTRAAISSHADAARPTRERTADQRRRALADESEIPTGLLRLEWLLLAADISAVPTVRRGLLVANWDARVNADEGQSWCGGCAARAGMNGRRASPIARGQSLPSVRPSLTRALIDSARRDTPRVSFDRRRLPAGGDYVRRLPEGPGAGRRGSLAQNPSFSRSRCSRYCGCASPLGAGRSHASTFGRRSDAR